MLMTQGSTVGQLLSCWLKCCILKRSVTILNLIFINAILCTTNLGTSVWVFLWKTLIWSDLHMMMVIHADLQHTKLSTFTCSSDFWGKKDFSTEILQNRNKREKRKKEKKKKKKKWGGGGGKDPPPPEKSNGQCSVASRLQPCSK